MKLLDRYIALAMAKDRHCLAGDHGLNVFFSIIEETDEPARAAKYRQDAAVCRPYPAEVIRVVPHGRADCGLTGMGALARMVSWWRCGPVDCRYGARPLRPAAGLVLLVVVVVLGEGLAPVAEHAQRLRAGALENASASGRKAFARMKCATFT
jgi:hypothetical protein